jgi:rfaE bifunctional protein kinase chain/domain
MITEDRLMALLESLPNISLAVVGDFFLDKYLILDPALTEISLETNLEAHQVVAKRCSPGAAGTVTSNLKALGVGSLVAVGFIGDDGEGYELRKGLEAGGVSTDALLLAPDRFTPTYIKPMFRNPDGSETESNRQDIKNRVPLELDVQLEILHRLRRVVREVDGVIVADQVQERNCGVLTDAVREEIARLAQDYPDKVFFADSRERIGEFRNVIVKPNRLEAMKALHPGRAVEATEEEARELGAELRARCGRPVYLTMSEHGMLLFDEDEPQRIPAVPISGEIDPVGAGDSCTSGIVSAICAGASLEEAGWIGNLVASVTVQKLGTTGTATPEEVRKALRMLSV